jgi:PAS domain S-box-containing protein
MSSANFASDNKDILNQLNLEKADLDIEETRVALKKSVQLYKGSLEKRDKYNRQLNALRCALDMPELYLDDDFNIVGFSPNFPVLTKRIYELKNKRMHIKKLIEKEDVIKIERYLEKTREILKLSYDDGDKWNLRYKGPCHSDELGKTWIPYTGNASNHWRIVERDGKLSIVHDPHVVDEVDCFLMTANEFSGPEEDIKVVYKIKTSPHKKNIRDLSLVISGLPGSESINPDLFGYTICTGSQYNTEARIQKESANLFVRPEVLDTDTVYEVMVERIGGKILRRLKNMHTGEEDAPLETIDTNAIYGGRNHIGLVTFSGEAEFFDFEIYTRRSCFSLDQFNIPFDTELGLEDEHLRDRVFKLRLYKDITTGMSLYIILFEDITDRKRAEEALRENEEKYRTLFEESKDPMSTTLKDGKFVDVNQAMLDLYGYSREEMLETNAAQFFVNTDDRKRFVQEIDKKGFVKDYEMRVKKKNGTEIDCMFNSTVKKDKQGSIWGYQTSVTDITERKRREHKPRPFFGKSPAIRKVLEHANIVLKSETAVTIIGETGAGKGIMARWIHDHSLRKNRTFVALNCSNLKGEMLASELFGHTKGAYTSAVQERNGLIQLADGGTLFLDEISNMSLSIQAEFLKVIEEKHYRRLGEDKTRKSDFRLICSSNRDLFEETLTGNFRQDLYFRIHVFPIYMPPLRKMLQDLPGLAQHILAELGAPHMQLSDAVIKLLESYNWPGNVRELRNVLERALLLTQGQNLSPEHFPGLGFSSFLNSTDEDRIDLKNIERTHILEVINKCGGDKTKAAKALGISRATIYRKLNMFTGND